MSEQKRSEDPHVMMLRMKYRALEEQWEHSHYWSTEHIAFHQIGTALQSPDPAQALQERVAKARTNLAQKEQMLLDGLFHGNPESFRKHYGTLIARFTTALQELGSDLVRLTDEANPKETGSKAKKEVTTCWINTRA